MTENPSEDTEPQGLVGALLAPLRAPQRVVGNIEAIATALLSLQRDAHDRLASVDERAGGLLRAVGALSAPLERLDAKVAKLEELEQSIREQTNAIRDDINARMLAVEGEVRGMRSPIERMSRDLATVVDLLPNPSDGPLARLKDTLTSS